MRDIEVESVSKMLACGTSILGVKHYTCGNDSCPHVKYLCNTCSCRACPSCGKRLPISGSPINSTAYPSVPGNTWCSHCLTPCGRCSFITVTGSMPCVAWPSTTCSMRADAGAWRWVFSAPFTPKAGDLTGTHTSMSRSPWVESMTQVYGKICRFIHQPCVDAGCGMYCRR